MNSNIDIIHKAVLVRSSLYGMDRHHSYFSFLLLKIMNDWVWVYFYRRIAEESTHERGG